MLFAVFVLDGFGDGVGVEFDSVGGEGFGQRQAEVFVETAQRQGLAVDEVGFGAQARENAGEFDADIAAADDDDAAGHFL